MSGKKSGLNAGLRKLLARIQREFDFPKVYIARLSAEARVRAAPEEPAPTVRRPPPIETVAHAALLAETGARVQTGALDFPICRHSAPLSAIAAVVREEPCLDPANIDAHRPQLGWPAVTPNTLDIGLSEPPIRTPQLAIAPPDLRVAPAILRTRLRDWLEMARQLPFQLKLYPMDAIPKKLQIRYRAAVLKMLDVKPKNVSFVGVCFGLPSAPLKIAGFELDGPEKRALARAIGPVNPYHGRRGWVIIRLEGRPQCLPITVREE